MTSGAMEKGEQLVHLLERLLLEVLGQGGALAPVPAAPLSTGCQRPSA